MYSCANYQHSQTSVTCMRKVSVKSLACLIRASGKTGKHWCPSVSLVSPWWPESSGMWDSTWRELLLLLGHTSSQSSTLEAMDGGEDVTSSADTDTVMLMGVTVLISSTSCSEATSVYSVDFTSLMCGLVFLKALLHSVIMVV